VRFGGAPAGAPFSFKTCLPKVKNQKERSTKLLKSKEKKKEVPFKIKGKKFVQ
jgi:hypothetical protein